MKEIHKTIESLKVISRLVEMNKRDESDSEETMSTIAASSPISKASPFRVFGRKQWGGATTDEVVSVEEEGSSSSVLSWEEAKTTLATGPSASLSARNFNGIPGESAVDDNLNDKFGVSGAAETSFRIDPSFSSRMRSGVKLDFASVEVSSEEENDSPPRMSPSSFPPPSRTGYHGRRCPEELDPGEVAELRSILPTMHRLCDGAQSPISEILSRGGWRK